MADVREQQPENIAMNVDDKPTPLESNTVESTSTCDEPCTSNETNAQNDAESKVVEAKEQQTQTTENVPVTDDNVTSIGEQPETIKLADNEAMHVDNAPNTAASSADAPDQAIVENSNICDEPSKSADSEEPNAGEKKLDEQKDEQAKPIVTATQVVTDLTRIMHVIKGIPIISEAASNADKIGSLKMLCQYGSDSEDDGGERDAGSSANDEDKAAAKSLLTNCLKSTDEYRLITSEDSNEDSDDDDDDDDDEVLSSVADDDEAYQFLKKCMGDASKEKDTSKSDMSFADLPPIADLKITVPESECVELGTVSGIVGTLVLVDSVANFAAVDIDTLLFLDKGNQALGPVFDVMGVVSSPIYCVRFNSTDDIERKKIKLSTKVYVAPKSTFTTFVVMANLMNTRGCDASWENDQEAPDGCYEYSDDEEERAARQQQRHKKRASTSTGDDSSNKNKTLVGGEPPFRRSAPNAYNARIPAIQAQSRGRRDQNFRGRQGNQYQPRMQSHMQPHMLPHMQPYPQQYQHQNNSWHHALPPPLMPQQMVYNPYHGVLPFNGFPLGRGRYCLDRFNMKSYPPLPTPDEPHPFDE